MSRAVRIRAEALAGGRSFFRRRTALFFTFVFPILLVLIFGVLVSAEAGGLFGEDPSYYVPGYLALVVLFTPLSRIGAEVTRHREGNRFEKLATTPLARWEWLLGHTVVNGAIIAVAAAIILVLVVAMTGAEVALGASELALLAAYVVVGVVAFCGVGAILGSIAETQDGVIAASNTVALPLVFLSETFVPPSLLPAWFRPAVDLSPLTYFARGVRTTLVESGGGGSAAGLSPEISNLLVLAAVAVVALVVGAYRLPRTD